MYLGAACLVTLLSGACAASNWIWPDEERSASVRIDTKVRFVDDNARNSNQVHADEIKPPLETDGFYNRPAGAGSGRYPVHTEQSQRLTHALDAPRAQYSDGTLDTIQYCKCVASPTPSCRSPSNLPKACATGMHLCCYKRSNRTPHGTQSEIFSELEDERPILLPSYERHPGLFIADPEDQENLMNPSQNSGFGNSVTSSRTHRPLLVGPDGPSGIIGPNHPNNRVLVGPSGPTGVLGPHQRNPGVLVGPDGPTGVIGPNHRDNRLVGPGVLAGPDGPTGIIGPNNRDVNVQGLNKRNPGVLVGPNGPTGVIGPNHRDDRDFTGPNGFVRPNQNNPGILVGPEGPTGHIGVPNHRDYLVGPDGPTGEIGPNRFKDVHIANHGAESAQVLVGPGGPTGIIGPAGRRGRWQNGPGLLVGPGGPTGIIGPGQRLLVGPGGPTGHIGPRGYGQYGF